MTLPAPIQIRRVELSGRYVAWCRCGCRRIWGDQSYEGLLSRVEAHVRAMDRAGSKQDHGRI